MTLAKFYPLLIPTNLPPNPNSLSPPNQKYLIPTESNSQSGLSGNPLSSPRLMVRYQTLSFHHNLRRCHHHHQYHQHIRYHHHHHYHQHQTQKILADVITLVLNLMLLLMSFMVMVMTMVMMISMAMTMVILMMLMMISVHWDPTTDRRPFTPVFLFPAVPMILANTSPLPLITFYITFLSLFFFAFFCFFESCFSLS